MKLFLAFFLFLGLAACASKKPSEQTGQWPSAPQPDARTMASTATEILLPKMKVFENSIRISSGLALNTICYSKAADSRVFAKLLEVRNDGAIAIHSKNSQQPLVVYTAESLAAAKNRRRPTALLKKYSPGTWAANLRLSFADLRGKDLVEGYSWEVAKENYEALAQDRTVRTLYFLYLGDHVLCAPDSYPAPKAIGQEEALALIEAHVSDKRLQKNEGSGRRFSFDQTINPDGTFRAGLSVYLGGEYKRGACTLHQGFAINSFDLSVRTQAPAETCDSMEM